MIPPSIIVPSPPLHPIPHGGNPPLKDAACSCTAPDLLCSIIAFERPTPSTQVLIPVWRPKQPTIRPRPRQAYTPLPHPWGVEPHVADQPCPQQLSPQLSLISRPPSPPQVVSTKGFWSAVGRGARVLVPSRLIRRVTHTLSRIFGTGDSKREAEDEGGAQCSPESGAHPRGGGSPLPPVALHAHPSKPDALVDTTCGWTVVWNQDALLGWITIG